MRDLDPNMIIFWVMIALVVALIGAFTFGLTRCWKSSKVKDRALDILALLSLWQWPVWMVLYVYGIPPTTSSLFWDVVPWPSLAIPFFWCIFRTHPIR